MTYEERQRYQRLTEQVEELRDRLAEGDPDEHVTRGEARELLEVVAAAVERMSPERWDRALDAVAQEAARRAGSGPPY